MSALCLQREQSSERLARTRYSCISMYVQEVPSTSTLRAGEWMRASAHFLMSTPQLTRSTVRLHAPDGDAVVVALCDVHVVSAGKGTRRRSAGVASSASSAART